MGIEVFIGGFIVPLLTSFFKDPNWSEKVKYGVALVVSFLVALASGLLDGTLTLDTLSQDFVAIVGSSSVIYTMLLKGTGLNSKLESMGVGSN